MSRGKLRIRFARAFSRPVITFNNGVVTGIRFVLLMVAALALGCAQANGDLGEKASGVPDAGSARVDANPNDLDGDGFEADVDCADNDALRNPSVAERCDGVDQDCDGLVDEDAIDGVTYYVDSDGDGFGAPDTEIVGCAVPDGHVENDDDCYDDNAAAKPGQTGYFSVDRGDGSFDYDCSSAVESSTPIGNCSYNGTDCGFSPGWDGSAPACGTSGDVMDACLMVCIGLCICEPSTGSQANECR